MIPDKSATAWSQELFSGCELGDRRRTERVMKVAAQLAQQGGGTVSAAYRGRPEAQQAGYRLLRNEAIPVAAILESGFAATAKRVAKSARLLAIDDTTTLSYHHGVREQLGDTGGPEDAYSRGYQVHSTLLVDADRGTTEGLIAQHVWCREVAQRGRKHQRKTRAYETKESYKWERNACAMRQRLGARMSQVIAVSDRESDIYEYLEHKLTQGERFIVRAAQNRVLENQQPHLFEALKEAVCCGERTVTIAQRAGRSARTAQLRLRALRVSLMAPANRSNRMSLTLNVVLAEETGAAKEPLRWIVLTSEAIDDAAQVNDIVRCYGLRWRIEEFHKAWKSGAGVEEQRHQSRDTLQRMMTLLAFVAVRLLQLREVLDNPLAAESACTSVLTELEWKLLWASQSPQKALPKAPPALHWAYRAIAKLGGFYDSKRTGRASWATLHLGLTRLDEQIQGYHLLSALDPSR